MWNYESQPGNSAHPPAQVAPAVTAAEKPPRPVLLVMAHPRCPCTSATIEELARVMGSTQEAVEARVYFFQPSRAREDWTQTALWRNASKIPGVQVLLDRDGREAQRYGAATSGQAMLYSADGRLLFSGGLTDSRGHSGASEGGRAILSLLTNPQAEKVTTPVYGCSLLAPAGASGTRVIER